MENNQEKNERFEDREYYQALAFKVKSGVFQDLEKYTTASEEMIAFQKANPEIINFELWHNLIGSTPPGKLVFDTEERKISKFVDELAEKYLER